MSQRKTRIFVVSTLLASVLGMAVAFAAIDYQSHTIPYSGYLESSGVVADGPYDFRFALYDDPAAGNLLWTDDFSALAVDSGRFSVLLGSGAALGDDVMQADALYLSIGIQGPADSDFVILSGRQKISHVPYAVRAESAKDFVISGRLRVDGAVHDGATTDLSGIDVYGPDNNTVDTAALRISSPGQNMLIDGNEINSDTLLYLQELPSGSGLGPKTHVGGHLEVEGDILIDNVANPAARGLFMPNAHCDCEIVGTNSHTDTTNQYFPTTPIHSGDPDGNGFIAGIHYEYCPAGKFMVGFGQEKDCGSTDNCVYDMTCCRPCDFGTQANKH